MDLSAGLATDLAILTEALDDPDIDLAWQLQRLAVDVGNAVPSYVGMSLTLMFDEHPVTLTAMASMEPIVSSLLLALVPAGESSIHVVFYAATRGAFVDLAADLSFALGRSHEAVILDANLIPPAAVDASGLHQYATVNRAIGVLIAGGFAPSDARAELRRLADIDGRDLAAAGEALIVGFGHESGSRSVKGEPL